MVEKVLEQDLVMKVMFNIDDIITYTKNKISGVSNDKNIELHPILRILMEKLLKIIWEIKRNI